MLGQSVGSCCRASYISFSMVPSVQIKLIPYKKSNVKFEDTTVPYRFADYRFDRLNQPMPILDILVFRLVQKG